MTPAERVTPEIETLARLFYRDLAELGDFTDVAPVDMPGVYQRLLAHEHHMTVTVESHYGGPVDVEVLDTLVTETHYARKIRLVVSETGKVVQFGIMRVNFDYLAPAVRRQIEAEGTPLGRVLIDHNVLRRVELYAVWRVQAGADLAGILDMDAGGTTYGRTALIHCNKAPAVELLEILSPVE